MPQAFADLPTYLRETFAPQNEFMSSLMPRAVERGLPQISLSPESGKTLYLLAKMINAAKILEIGTLAGYSGIWLAQALPEQGKMITLEINAHHAEVARENFVAAGVGDKVEIRLGPAGDLLPEVAKEGPFDLCFIDADKDGYPKYLDFALANVRSGGLIIADNADAHGRAHEVLNEGESARFIQIYNERVATDPRLVSMIIPVGGWLAVSLVL
jgi:predicted O-methyltransferase YrrM